MDRKQKQEQKQEKQQLLTLQSVAVILTKPCSVLNSNCLCICILFCIILFNVICFRKCCFPVKAVILYQRWRKSTCSVSVTGSQTVSAAFPNTAPLLLWFLSVWSFSWSWYKLCSLIRNCYCCFRYCSFYLSFFGLLESYRFVSEGSPCMSFNYFY